MAQIATVTDILEAAARGFLEDLQEQFRQHEFTICSLKNGWVIEGEREVIRPAGFSYTTDILWYNVLFLPNGVRMEGGLGRYWGYSIDYDDPKLFDHLTKAIYEYTKSW